MGPVEPSADMRVMASQLRQMYVALVSEGFTVIEAMTMISQVIAASVQNGRQ